MFEIIVQRASTATPLPSDTELTQWAEAALQNKRDSAELTIRIVDEDEMIHLNHTYRNKLKPTNVLSFPFDMPPEIQDEIAVLGDIVICASVIQSEARAQHKTERAHWAHMVVHGTLHLLGYDHEKNDDAVRMETEEIKILHALGFDNPYHIEGNES